MGKGHTVLILCLLLTSSEVFIIFLCSSRTSFSVSVAQMENPTTESLSWNEGSLASDLKHAKTGHLAWKQILSSKHFKFPSLCFFHKHKLFKPLNRMLLAFQKNTENYQGKFQKHLGALDPYELCAWLLFQPSLRPQKGTDYQLPLRVPTN